jgi:glutamate-ammonia-ligase adenylyltransferase
MVERLQDAEPDWEPSIASELRRDFVAVCLKEAYHGDVRRTFSRLTRTAETAIIESLDRLGGEQIEVIAMGRLGGSELLLPSDWDVMLLVRDDDDQLLAERTAQEWLRVAQRLAMLSGYFPLDIRLRPEGSSGLVVRSMQGFATYTRDSMETWERLAMTRARPLRGWSESSAAINTALAGKEWGWDEETEILAMRKRVQSERLHAWELHRDLKLGDGFLLDIEWLIAMLKLRHSELVTLPTNTISALHALADCGALQRQEADALESAVILYSRLRDILYLLEFDSDSVIPENPEKLERVANTYGASSGNDLLRSVEESRAVVSAVTNELVLRN